MLIPVAPALHSDEPRHSFKVTGPGQRHANHARAGFSDYPERLAAVSATAYLATNGPPTLFIQPERDDFISAPGTLGIRRKCA